MPCLEQTRVLYLSWLDENPTANMVCGPWVLLDLGRCAGDGVMSCLAQTCVLHGSWSDETQRLIWSVVLGLVGFGQM